MEDKTYLRPGDVVLLKLHNLMFSPKMLVLRKETKLFKDGNNLKGIRCRWFTDSGLLLESVFSTKDLIKVE